MSAILFLMPFELSPSCVMHRVVFRLSGHFINYHLYFFVIFFWHYSTFSKWHHVGS